MDHSPSWMLLIQTTHPTSLTEALVGKRTKCVLDLQTCSSATQLPVPVQGQVDAPGYMNSMLGCKPRCHLAKRGLSIPVCSWGVQDAALPSCRACRYAYRQQPEIGQWNLVALANAFIAADLVGKEEAEEVLVTYSKVRCKNLGSLARRAGGDSFVQQALLGHGC